MASIEIREHAQIGDDGVGREIQIPAEPAIAVHRLDTAGGAQTVGPFNPATTFVTIFADVAVAYEVAATNPDAAAGPKRGSIPAASMPFAMAVPAGYSIQVNG